MDRIGGRARRTLEHLYVILDAGEKGYAVAAANVSNRALKMLFKTYARQRSEFKSELRNQAGRNRMGLHSLIDVMAMIHRGRISIFAAMTIGDQKRERVVLKEVLVGERAALRAYQQAVGAGLPPKLNELVETQFGAVQQTVSQVELMRGKDGKERVVRLYDTEADAKRATQALQEAHLADSGIQEVSVEDETGPYQGERNATLLETVLSGVAGGALWGAVSGALAGFGVLHLPTLGLERAPLAIQEMAWAATVLGAIFSGGFVGAMLGMFIGWGVQGGDSYLYNESQRQGRVLLKVESEPARAAEAAQVMARVNHEARSRGGHVVA